MPRVVHFEFPSTNMEASRKFFEAVLGWRLEKWGDEEYWMAYTGDPANPGINGALYVPSEQMSGTVNTVDVENLDAALEKVVANGGQVIAPRMEIAGVGWLAYVRDPGGAFFGMMEAMPGGMM